MGHWGWRPVSIVICICVWIVGCTDQHEDIVPTRTPTIIPQIRLLLRPTKTRLSDDDPALTILATMPPVAPELVERTELASTLIPSYVPISVSVHPPNCYESAPGGVVCYGLVENTTPSQLGRVALHAFLLDINGAILREQTTSLDQRTIPAGGLAPYRFLFAAGNALYLSERFGGIAVQPSSIGLGPADNVQSAEDMQLISATWDDERYRVQVRVTGPLAGQSTDLRVVVTLLDSQQRVTGYRVVDLQNVSEPTELDVAIDTQVRTGELEVLLYAERLNP